LAVIPAGDLLVGDDDLEFAKVRVQSHFETFCIDQTEVTVADYEACVEAGGCQTPRSLSGCNWGVSGQENHPVTCIDWPRADAYCRWAGKRLPNEWEWEFAARGPNGNAYPWGNQAPSSQYLNWKYEAVGGATTSVGAYPDGQTVGTHVFDMAGNVWEWTGSVWCDSKDPNSACEPGVYTARGGSFGSSYDIHVRSAWRDPDSAGDHRFGFRCAYGAANP
jgi:formylglycine-generating enzyme required for sulfatase activity